MYIEEGSWNLYVFLHIYIDYKIIVKQYLYLWTQRCICTLAWIDAHHSSESIFTNRKNWSVSQWFILLVDSVWKYILLDLYSVTELCRLWLEECNSFRVVKRVELYTQTIPPTDSGTDWYWDKYEDSDKYAAI